jgi:GntR family transcriptional repressor for pyruvate dehydrogenase complex
MPQLVADDLRRQVVAGELLPGDLLPPEAELLGLYGVSRPTLREAMRILEAESLVLTRRGSKGGVIVQVPDPEVVYRQAGVALMMQGVSFIDAFSARVEIEPAAARLLAEAQDPGSIETLTNIITDASGDRPQQLGAHGGEFHRQLVELCGNKALAFVARLLASITDETYVQLTHSLPQADLEHGLETVVQSWRELVALIVLRDGSGAEQHWRAHMAEMTRGVQWATSQGVASAEDRSA